MREYKGVTHTKAYCVVCKELSPTTIHTTNGILVRVHIECEEHKRYLLNESRFVQGMM
jgi:hypothetical protein